MTLYDVFVSCNQTASRFTCKYQPLKDKNPVNAAFSKVHWEENKEEQKKKMPILLENNFISNFIIFATNV